MKISNSKEQKPSNRLLIVNFSSSELTDVTKVQIRKETRVDEVTEIHLPCHFNLNRPLPPQIANVVALANEAAKNKGFVDGLLAHTVIVPPGFADAAFIMGAWMAYANVGAAGPIRTLRFNTGWTATLFQSPSLPVDER